MNNELCWPKIVDTERQVDSVEGSTMFVNSGCISLLLPRLRKLFCPFEKDWMGDLGNLSSSKEVQPHRTGYLD